MGGAKFVEMNAHTEAFSIAVMNTAGKLIMQGPPGDVQQE